MTIAYTWDKQKILTHFLSFLHYSNVLHLLAFPEDNAVSIIINSDAIQQIIHMLF